MQTFPILVDLGAGPTQSFDDLGTSFSHGEEQSRGSVVSTQGGAGAFSPVFVGKVLAHELGHGMGLSNSPVDPTDTGVTGHSNKEVVVEPPGLHAEALQHLEQAVDLLDPGDPAQRGAPPVEQGGAEQGDPGVLRRLDVDPSGERGGTVDTQVGATVTDGDDLGVEHLPDPCDELQRDAALPALDVLDLGRSGLQHLGELLPGPAAMLAGVPDEPADTGAIGVSHPLILCPGWL